MFLEKSETPTFSLELEENHYDGSLSKAIHIKFEGGRVEEKEDRG